MRGKVVLVRDGLDVASWPLVSPAQLDASIVEDLARLQLLAHRHGWSIRLEGLCPDLTELLELCGLRVEVGG